MPTYVKEKDFSEKITNDRVSLWGEKTLKSDSILNKVYIRRLLIDIRKSIEGLLDSYILEKNDNIKKNVITSSIYSYLEVLSKRNAIQNDYDVEGKLIHRNWNDIYYRKEKPSKSIFQKYSAMFYYYIFCKFFKKSITYSKSNIFTHLFPFNKQVDEIDVLEDLKLGWAEENEKFEEDLDYYWEKEKPSLEWIENWLEKYEPVKYTTWKMIVPYEILEAYVYISPVKSVDIINLTFTLDSEGVSFEKEV